MTLEEFIAEQRRIVRERRERGEIGPPKPPPTPEYEALLAANVADAIVRMGDSFPEPLHPFAIYSGKRPDLETLQSYPVGWLPRFFKIVAPGLLEMAFTTTGLDPAGLIHVQSIYVGAEKFGSDWAEAVNFASE